MKTAILNKIQYTLLTTIILGFVTTESAAQQVLQSGTVVYERKVNMHKVMDENNGGGDNQWVEMFKKNNPKFKITNFDLHFTDSTSTYLKSKEQPPEEPGRRGGGFMRGGEEDQDVTFKNMNSGAYVAQKQMFEKLILLQDTLPRLRWTLTKEFRQFAGYNCRKATTIMFDSVFVIAYYTDALACATGPQSLNGLPGVILCAHIPRIHTTYAAKEVKPLSISPADIAAPSKGNKHTYLSIVEKIASATEDWGKRWKGRIIWGFLL
jgi:GLPGLI family protein